MPRGRPGSSTACTIEGCAGKSVGRGLCRKHYTRWHAHGDPSVVVDQSRGVCSIEGCEKPHKGQGYCQTHYRRLQRHGDPLVQGKHRAEGDVEERFWGYVDLLGPVPRIRPHLGHCWIWTGYINPRFGYGEHAVEGRMVRAHSWGYKRFAGSIPEGLELDHLCRVLACVRFSHLEPVTHIENVRRGFRDRRTSATLSVD